MGKGYKNQDTTKGRVMASIWIKAQFRDKLTQSLKINMVAVTVSIIRDSDQVMVVTDAAAIEFGLGLYGYEFDFDVDQSYTGTFNAGQTDVSDQFPTVQIGDPVRCSEVEQGFDLGRTLRIIAAAAAGKADGGPQGPRYRNLNDTEDMVTSTATEEGNRLAVTYGA